MGYIFEFHIPDLRYRKSSIKPPREGGYLILDTPEGAYQRGEAFAQNLMTRTYIIAFQFFYPILLIYIHKFETFSIPNTIKTNMQACLGKYMEMVGNFWNLI